MRLRTTLRVVLSIRLVYIQTTGNTLNVDVTCKIQILPAILSVPFALIEIRSLVFSTIIMANHGSLCHPIDLLNPFKTSSERQRYS